MNKLNWDEYFMAMAKITGMRSKDPNTQVGAVIVNKQKRVIGLGYNGMPHGNDNAFPWDREGVSAKETKYPYVIHAELNAVLNSTVKLDGATLYVSLFPCSNCAKLIAQSGVVEIVYAQDIYDGTEDNQISKHILNVCNVSTRHVKDISVEVK